MHLSYNVIKVNRVMPKETKTISTELFLNNEDKEQAENSQVSLEKAQEIISNYENIGRKIIEDAKLEKLEILKSAKELAKDIEREAYEKGYNQGLINGNEDGKKEALEKYIPIASEKANTIIQDAERIFKNANKSYEEYLDRKRNEIIGLSLSIAEQVLKREVSDVSGLNGLIDEVIKISKGSENIVIKCNDKYKEELEKNIPIWRTLNNISGEIFILVDNNISEGNAIIERSTGKVEVGIDIGLEKIREAIL